jgi:putative alpha-1,2-mannosidase
VKSVTFNGKPLADRRIHHNDLVRGGELVFEMDGKIEARWALARANAKR